MLSTFTIYAEPIRRFRRHKTIEITLTLKYRDMLGVWRECDIWMDADGNPIKDDDNKYLIGNIDGLRAEITKKVEARELGWFDRNHTKWAVE